MPPPPPQPHTHPPKNTSNRYTNKFKQHITIPPPNSTIPPSAYTHRVTWLVWRWTRNGGPCGKCCICDSVVWSRKPKGKVKKHTHNNSKKVTQETPPASRAQGRQEGGTDGKSCIV